MDRRSIVLFLIALACVGCHGGPPPEFPDWVSRFASPAQHADSSNAFSDYVRAADQAEKDGGRYLDMVSFYPGQREKAEELTAGALNLLVSTSSRKCDFEFSPVSPFAAPPHQRGWRILGRDLVWRIQEAVRAQDYDKAVYNAVIATKFGYDISGGGATDASLGLAIVDEARQAIAPSLGNMGAGQLGSLADGITKALESKPPLSVTIEHEHQNMLEGVQTIQDAYRANDFENVLKNLGGDCHTPVEFLQDLHRKDTTKRPEYFQSFASEADEDVKYMETLAALPVAQRSTVPAPKLKPDRPWRKFAKHFFSSLPPLLQMNDATLARTRLLILEASILRQVKATGSAPKDLSDFAQDLRTDPYSGVNFVYGSDGADYHVYSVGENLQDDGGDTDETFSQPDLKLERTG